MRKTILRYRIQELSCARLPVYTQKAMSPIRSLNNYETFFRNSYEYGNDQVVEARATKLWERESPSLPDVLISRRATQTPRNEKKECIC